MKRYITLLLMVVILFASIPAKADMWTDELGQLYSYGEIRTTKPGGYGQVIYEHCDETRMITFKPTSVRTQAQRTSFVVFANVTTASPLIAVQWSTDPKFKKDLHTRFYKNSSYKDKVHINIVSHFDKKVSPLTTWTRVIYQGNRKLDYRKVQLDDDTMETTTWIVDRMRAKVSLTKRLYVPDVKTPTRYYVRVRNIYDNQYSPWSTVVKVR